MQRKTAILTSLFLVLSGHVLAEHRAHGKNAMARMDTDGDEQISLDEFRAPGQHRWEQADVNDDGAVTLTELKTQIADYESKRRQRKAARIEAHFAEMDINKDGSVTGDEARLSVFSKIDANQDGFLSRDEMRQAKKLRRNHPRQHGHRRQDKRNDSGA